MALTILSDPTNYQPVYSIDGHNLSFVLNSTISQQCSMKYVADVYVRGEYITTIKNSPNLGGGKCVIEVGEILSDFISYNYWKGPNFQICPDSYLTYSVRFGEESDGSLDCSGTSFDTVYSGSTFSNIAFNGTLQYNQTTFNPLTYYIGPSFDNANARFLTNAPTTRSINTEETDVLYYISYDEVEANVGASASHALEIIVTYNDGSSDTWYALNRNASPERAILAIGTGPNDINSYVAQGIVYNDTQVLATQSIITCDTSNYKVRITDF